jgi:2-polyprenyl-6-methoxyphenol hydroxylase-like FAD-dependent oxidoreductase
MAGLLAARVLADHFDRVTIIERDRLPQYPEPRKGVPQARHLHVLLARGRLILEELFPSLVEQLVALGAPVIDMAMDLAWLTPAGWGARCKSGVEIVGCSRDLLEWCVRRRLSDFENVGFLGECDVIGLSCGDAGKRVAGVNAKLRGEGRGDLAISCDFAVDASGRGSPAPRWLEQIGCEPPRETVVDAFLGYSSRVYRRPPGARDWQGVYVQPAPPSHGRGGALFPVEGNRWILTLAGYGRDYPPGDESGFMEFARGLRTRVIYEAIKEAEPVSPVFTYRATENRLRHYEQMSRPVEGFIVLGDAACAFNPVYAQGMTMAALSASTLDQCLREQSDKRPSGDLTGLTRRFQKRLAAVNAPAWMLATSEDFRVPQCEGKPPARLSRLLQRYVDRVVHLSTRDDQARVSLLEVFNMLKPPAALLNVRMLSRIMLHSLGHSSQPRRRASHNEEVEGAPLLS